MMPIVFDEERQTPDRRIRPRIVFDDAAPAVTRPKDYVSPEIANDPISQAALKASKPQGIMETGGRWFYGDPNATGVQRIAANPLTRFAVGAASPILGAAQFLQNAGTIGTGQDASLNRSMQGFDEMKRAGGADGFDAVGLAGSVLSPASLAAMRIAPAASLPGRVGQGAAIGIGFGAATPVTNGGENFWADKGIQTGAGTLIGAGVPAALEGAKAVGAVGRRIYRGVLEPFFQTGRNMAKGRYYTAVAGDRVDEISNALRTPQSNVPGYSPTAAEVVARLPTSVNPGQAEFAGLQANVAQGSGSAVRHVEKQQGGAVVDALRSFGGTPRSMQVAIDDRDLVTGPMRETALKNANLAGVKVGELQDRLARQQRAVASALQNQGRMLTDAAQAESLANGRPINLRGDLPANAQHGPIPGQTEHNPFNVGAANFGGRAGTPLPPGLDAQDIMQYPIMRKDRTDVSDLLNRIPEAKSAATDFATVAGNRRAQAGLTQYQLDSLAAHGHYPLEANKVVGAIDKMLSTPGDSAVTLNQKILGAVRDKSASLADKNGVINSRDLYAVRKTDINDVVESLTKDLDASTKNRAAGLVSSIKGDIDNAIEGAGGAGWKDYLQTYAARSRDIDQMKIGQALEQRLTGALQGDEALRPGVFATGLRDAANIPQRSTGAPRYTKIEEALTPQNMQTVNNVKDVLANQAEAKTLAVKGSKAASEFTGTPDIIIPPTLSTTGAMLRTATRLLQGKGTKRMDQEMAREMLTDTPAVARLMDEAKSRQLRMKAIADYLDTRSRGAIAGGTYAAQGE